MEPKFLVSTVRGVISAPYALPEGVSYDISNGALLYQTNLLSNADWLCSVLNGDSASTITFINKSLSVEQTPREYMFDRGGSFLFFIEAERIDGMFFVCTSRGAGVWLLEKLNDHLTNGVADAQEVRS